LIQKVIIFFSNNINFPVFKSSLEYWNAGMMEKWVIEITDLGCCSDRSDKQKVKILDLSFLTNHPIFHHSNIPKSGQNDLPTYLLWNHKFPE